MISASIGKLSSNAVYTLLNSAKGSVLESQVILAAHGARDKREKFVNKNPEQVTVEDSKDVQISNEIRKSQSWEARVVQHERAHMQAGGEFAGSASYVYNKGVDGRTYITGGEVSMKVPAGGDPEQMKYALERVKRAAMAPADPSPQDLKTAAMAASRQSAVSQEIIREKALKAYEKHKQEKKQTGELTEIEPFRNFAYKEISSFEMAI